MGLLGRQRGAPAAGSGFTLIELMVAIAVAAILVALAIPSFETTINSGRLSSASNEMMAGLQSARMEAIRRNRRAVFCLSPAPDAATPSCNSAGAIGWVVFRDDDKDGVPTASDVVMVGGFPPAVKMKSSAAFGTRVTFRADGFAYDASGNPLVAAVGLCIPTRRPPENIRYLNIGGGSRVSITRGRGDGMCPTSVNDNNPPT